MRARFMVGVCAALSGLVVAAPGRTAIDSDKFVGVWLLDEGHGKKAVDASGNKRDGQIKGNQWDWIDGKFGGAVALSGNDDFIAVDEFGSVMPTDDITIVIWARIDDSGRNQPLLSLDPFDVNDGGVWVGGRVTVLMPWDGLAQWHFGTPFQFATIPFPEAAVGEWWHWAFVSSTSADLITFYMNGVEAGNQHVGGLPAELERRPDPFDIGWGLGDTFEGAVDEVAVYDGALETDDILDIMNEGLGRYVAGAFVDPAGGLAVLWAEIKRGS